MTGVLVREYFIPIAPCGCYATNKDCPRCLRRGDCCVATGQKNTLVLAKPE